VDIYFGGAEHAVGHLLYSRMWHKFLFDLGYVQTEEPFQKLVNQGMIQGVSAFVYRFDPGYIQDGKFKSLRSNLFLTKSIADGIVSGSISPTDLQEIITVQFGPE